MNRNECITIGKHAKIVDKTFYKCISEGFVHVAAWCHWTPGPKFSKFGDSDGFEGSMYKAKAKASGPRGQGQGQPVTMKIHGQSKSSFFFDAKAEVNIHRGP